ncbi:Hypothetical protein A7982_04266 [Minicystis rosea]|nr:Hypothetical protein A7982_04266 [Minicystis rosea]
MAKLSLGSLALIALGCAVHPHEPGATHPASVRHILGLLPTIPSGAGPDQVHRFLGIAPDRAPDGGGVESGEMTEVFNLAPGYRLELSFAPAPEANPARVRFSAGSISAQRKPGFAPDEWHTLYPYRQGDRLVRQ